jgi:hypothetical protein
MIRRRSRSSWRITPRRSPSSRSPVADPPPRRPSPRARYAARSRRQYCAPPRSGSSRGRRSDSRHRHRVARATKPTDGRGLHDRAGGRAHTSGSTDPKPVSPHTALARGGDSGRERRVPRSRHHRDAAALAHFGLTTAAGSIVAQRPLALLPRFHHGARSVRDRALSLLGRHTVHGGFLGRSGPRAHTRRPGGA